MLQTIRKAAGRSVEELVPLTHEQVVEVANRARPHFIALVKSWMAEV